MFFLSGCGANFHYLMQAAQGQLALANRARPISEVLKDPRTSPRLHDLLAQIEPIKKFGESKGLKPTKNYSDYVQLDRPAATWIVSACEPLKFQTKTWSFPVVGTFPYLGWFDLRDAQTFSQKLKSEGLDVDLRGARAYSTLGWFRDAVLSSMIPEPPVQSQAGDSALGDLVDVVLHESVHATLYIPGQSFFNESLAEFVAEKMTQDYFDFAHLPQQKKLYLQQLEFAEGRVERLHQAYQDLEEIYRSTLPDQAKMLQKKAYLTALQDELHFKREINNATLIQYRAYHTGRKTFEDLLQRADGDWRRFFAMLRPWHAGSFKKPQDEDF